MQLIAVSASPEKLEWKKESKKYVKNFLQIKTCVSRFKEPTQHNQWGNIGT